MLSRGRIGQWADELKLAAKVVSGLRQLGRRPEIPVGFRLGVALQLLNPQLPLIYEEAIVTPSWLLGNHRLGHELITGPIPNMLESFGIESDGWLMQLCRRAKAVEEMARILEIELDRDRLQVLVLSEHAPLAMQWECRRRDLPDANQPGLASLIERRHHSTEDLIILLAANLAQYRSFEEIREGRKSWGRSTGYPYHRRSRLEAGSRCLVASSTRFWTSGSRGSHDVPTPAWTRGLTDFAWSDDYRSRKSCSSSPTRPRPGRNPDTRSMCLLCWASSRSGPRRRPSAASS